MRLERAILAVLSVAMLVAIAFSPLRASADPPQILGLTPVPDSPSRAPSQRARRRPYHHRRHGYDYATYSTPVTSQRTERNMSPTHYVGWRFSAGIAPTRAAAIGMGTFEVRIRLGAFGLDVGLFGLLGGEDHDREARIGLSLPATFYNFYYFVNPDDAFQAYGVGSLFLTIESQRGPGDRPNQERLIVHLGAALGAGVEWRFSPYVSFDLDARALIQQNLADGRSEFVEPGTGRRSNTSVGALLSAAMILRY